MSTTTTYTFVPRANRDYCIDTTAAASRDAARRDLAYTLIKDFGEERVEVAFDHVYLQQDAEMNLDVCFTPYESLCAAFGVCEVDTTMGTATAAVHERIGGSMKTTLTDELTYVSEAPDETYVTDTDGRGLCATAYTERGVYMLPSLPTAWIDEQRDVLDGNYLDGATYMKDADIESPDRGRPDEIAFDPSSVGLSELDTLGLTLSDIRHRGDVAVIDDPSPRVTEYLRENAKNVATR